MITQISKREEAPWYNRLFLPAYSVGDAARYAGSHPKTVSAWHNRRNPVLPGHQPKQPLSYMELVEVAFVAFFRKAGVPMNRIRQARAYVAANFESDYPFTEYRFKTEGMHLLMDYFPRENKSVSSRIIVADAAGQLAWDALLGEKFSQFDYELDLAVTWHPVGRGSSVRIDPRIAFGKPIAEGIPTWTIKARWVSGNSLEEIGEDFEVSQQAILDALRFEGVELGYIGYDH